MNANEPSRRQRNAMTRKDWLLHQRKMAKRLSAALKRLPLSRKREVMVAYARFLRQSGKGVWISDLALQSP